MMPQKTIPPVHKCLTCELDCPNAAIRLNARSRAICFRDRPRQHCDNDPAADCAMPCDRLGVPAICRVFLRLSALESGARVKATSHRWASRCETQARQQVQADGTLAGMRSSAALGVNPYLRAIANSGRKDDPLGETSIIPPPMQIAQHEFHGQVS